MEIETKLAEAKANAKLIDTEFDKLKLELKDSNDKMAFGVDIFLGVMLCCFWSGFSGILKQSRLIEMELKRVLQDFRMV